MEEKTVGTSGCSALHVCTWEGLMSVCLARRNVSRQRGVSLSFPPRPAWKKSLCLRVYPVWISSQAECLYTIESLETELLSLRQKFFLLQSQSKRKKIRRRRRREWSSLVLLLWLASSSMSAISFPLSLLLLLHCTFLLPPFFASLSLHMYTGIH